MSRHVQRVAHRGGASLAPENTLAAFRNALTMPIDAIELDVQMSRDGQLVVFHDSTVERLTDGEGNLLDLDFDYLRSLNAAAHFPEGWPEHEQIPTLHEVLDLAKGRVKVYIEIKPSERDGTYGRYPKIAEAVVKEVRKAKMLRQVLIISFDWPMLNLVKWLEPALQTGALVSRATMSSLAAQEEKAQHILLERMRAIGANWVNMESGLFTEIMLERIHDAGYKIGLWTVNTLVELRSFVAAGVDSITTDRPDLFAEL